MTEQKRIVYRNVTMIEGWPEKIAEAQLVTAWRLGERDIPRIRYGSESANWNADKVACHDCAVVKGEFHVPGCDVEECPLCDNQLISCGCFDEAEDGTEE